MGEFVPDTTFPFKSLLELLSATELLVLKIGLVLLTILGLAEIVRHHIRRLRREENSQPARKRSPRAKRPKSGRQR
jgi:hypothetical protein